VTLPEPVPPKLAAVLDALPPENRGLVEDRLTRRSPLGGYAIPADLLAVALTEAGTPIGQTTIKQYRRLVLNRQEARA
jgi:hypothetical protein